MKNISDIYKEYKIMPSLADHMFRVAAVASMICDNFDESLPKEDIVTACLLHDMGNIIKSKFEVLPEFWEPQGVEYWKEIKNEYIKKYGSDEHEANVEIGKELATSPAVAQLIDGNEFSLMCEHKDGADWATKIVKYADGRAAPTGIVSYEERMNEAKKRYILKNNTEEEERQRLVACGQDIEHQIFSKCKIKPEDITDESAAPIIALLRNFVIK